MSSFRPVQTPANVRHCDDPPPPLARNPKYYRTFRERSKKQLDDGIQVGYFFHRNYSIQRTLRV